MISWEEHKNILEKLKREQMTYREIAEAMTQILGETVTKMAVKSAMRRINKKNGKGADLPKKLVLDLSSFAVISDLHIPFHNEEMLDHLFSMMTRFDVPNLIIAGDFSNQDQVSDYPNDSPLQMSFHQEMTMCGDMLVAIDEEMQRISKDSCIVITNGNHDERAQKKLGQDVRLDGLIYYMLQGRVLKSKLIITPYDHVFVNCDGIPWIIAHGSGYNKRPGEFAMRLAQKYQANVAVGHDHNQGFTSTPDGKFLALSIGSMVHTDDDGNTPLWYSQKSLNTYPFVKNGFLIVKNGIPFLFGKNGSTCLNGSRSWDFWYLDNIKSVIDLI
jgi:predicted phosphodiesterase